jgi:hypothetical protein
MPENAPVYLIVGGALAGVFLLFWFFSGPDRADRPQVSVERPAPTTGTAPERR